MRISREVNNIRTWINDAHKFKTNRSSTNRRRNSSIRQSISSRRSFLQSFQSDDDDYFPSNVQVEPHLETSLEILDNHLLSSVDSSSDVDSIVESVAILPNLMKTILLIEDKSDRDRILSYRIVKRVMLCKHSVVLPEDLELMSNNTSSSVSLNSNSSTTTTTGGRSSWLVKMLKARKIALRSRAVDYLELISNLTLQDYVLLLPGAADNRRRSSNAKQENDNEEDVETSFLEKRNELFNTVANLRGFFRTMLTLSDKDRKRASITDVVRRTVDYAMYQPFGITVLFLDVLCCITLLLLSCVFVTSSSFRTLQSVSPLRDPLGPIILYLLGMISLAYVSLREMGQLISTATVSWRVCRIHFVRFSKLIDLATIGIVLTSFLWGGRGKEIVSAIAIGLLWLKMLNILKVIHLKFATFILAIVQVMKDIRLFILLILIMIMALGDMMFIILASNEQACQYDHLTNDNQTALSRTVEYTTSPFFVDWIQPPNILLQEQTQQQHTLTSPQSQNSLSSQLVIPPNNDDEQQPNNPFCQSRQLSYLEIYINSIDPSADHFQTNKSTTTLFLVLTFFGVIVLFNIFIAIVREAYQKSMWNSERLLGTSRLELVAQLRALEDSLLLPCIDNNSHKKKMSWESFANGGIRWCSISIAMLLVLLFGLVILLFVRELMDTNDVAFVFGVSCVMAVFSEYLVCCTFFYTGWNIRDEDGDDRRKGLKAVFVKLQQCLLVADILPCFVRRMLGSSSTTTTTNNTTTHRGTDATELKWMNYQRHIQQETQKTTIEMWERRIQETLLSLEHRLDRYEMEETNFEKRLERDVDEFVVSFRRQLDEYELRLQAQRREEAEELEKCLLDCMSRVISDGSQMGNA